MHKTALTILAAVLPVIVAGELLGATKARADIIMTVNIDDMSTGVITQFSIQPGSPLAGSGSTANDLLVNLTVLNTDLANGRTGLSFGSLSASSNNPGLATGAFLVETGMLNSTTSDLITVTVTASQTGFTDPTGLGTLTDSSGATFVNNATGKVATHASLDTTDTGITDIVSTGLPTNTQPGGSTIAAMAGASYSLDADAVLSNQSTSSSTSFSDAAGFNTPSETPLPAALPLFATGLGALGLLGWRRKRKARAGVA